MTTAVKIGLPRADRRRAGHDRHEQAEERERRAAHDGGHGRHVEEHEAEPHERVDEDRQPLVAGQARQHRLAGDRERGEDHDAEQLQRCAAHGGDDRRHRGQGGGVEDDRVGHEPRRQPGAQGTARPQVGAPRPRRAR